MPFSINLSKPFTVTYAYTFPHRSTANLLQQYKKNINVFTVTKRGSRLTPVMFLRSPKHFKTGKQIIYFFNRRYVYQKHFMVANPHILKTTTHVLFNFFKNYAPKFYTYEIFLTRISVITTAHIKF